MTRRLGVYLAAAVSLPLLSLSAPASAAELPPIKTSDDNRVAECATPGRLMAYLKDSNAKLDPRYEAIATEYMKNGEELGVRWDYAFFQMLLETAYLRYGGDVKPAQNNFAGLGATGGGARGESFADISSGARAHLQHLLMYAGDHVADPVAQRTKNVQEWGVLDGWLKNAPRPITFTAMTREWAPGSRGYSNDIKTIADRFFKGACNQPDPHPEYVAQARGNTGVTVATASSTPRPETKGTELARRANADARAEGNATRTGLGVGDVLQPQTATTTAAVTAPPAASAPTASPPVKIINAATIPDIGTSAPAKTDATAKASAPPAKIETASVAGAAKTLGVPTGKKDAGKCRVWTASYGGTKAIIIKAVSDQTTNYTVLDVNDGTDKREADAYIQAYAKGGERVAEFPSQSQALDKAFELCPDG